MDPSAYDDVYVQALFDRMGRTYDLVNWISSFGFSALWRRQCVRSLPIREGAMVCDMMAGTGECWPCLWQSGAASITSVDFSRTMVERQAIRIARGQGTITRLCENATMTSLADNSMDYVVSAFGLKTLSGPALTAFAKEIHRVLKPGGQFSLIEISVPVGWVLAPVYRWYMNQIIPWVGKICLGDIDCYRMLGTYTAAFGSCHTVASVFRDAGLEVTVKSHFHGCATSLVGGKSTTS